MHFKSKYVRALKQGARAFKEYLVMHPKRSAASYSQCGEDLLLESFFQENMPPNQAGSYVDIGCYHPFRYSNTCIFYKKGWRGLNIDPSPGVIELFNKHRPGDINIDAAISNSADPVTLNIFNEGAVNSIDSELSGKRDGQRDWKLLGRKTIVPMSLAAVLDKYWPPGRPIDFFDIDVEGLDYEVLLSNDWEKYRPQYVLIEDDTPVDKLENSRIAAFLNRRDYMLVAATRLTKIHARR